MGRHQNNLALTSEQKELVEKNIQIAENAAGWFARARGIRDYDTIQELKQQCRIALIYSARRFDQNKGASFLTYSSRWLRVFLCRNGHASCVFKIPKRIYDASRRIERIQFTTGCTLEEALDKYDGMECKNPHLRDAVMVFLYHRIPVNGEDKSDPLSNGIQLSDSSAEKNVTSEIIRKDSENLYEKIFQKAELTKRNINIFKQIYFGEYNQAEIARKYGISRERVRQIYNDVIRKCQKVLKCSEFRKDY
jgi:RNA polymerase primary sigma factor